MNPLSSLDESNLPHPEAETLDQFLKKFEGLPSAEEKLRTAISYMRLSLSQGSTPYFKGFWEVRKLCLPLFKEEITSPSRSNLWSDYVELTREGRRLKNLLDEESAFAVEQIDMAIKALEGEVQSLHEQPDLAVQKAPEVAFAGEPKSLQGTLDEFQMIQRKLNLLNLYASRVNALRKELIKTEMRIRQKNKFFERLSHLGDHVFPPRKELIQGVSDKFFGSVEKFVESNFSERAFNPEKIRKSVFFYREEIKQLQALAKLLTLNTETFTKTRELLSQCWDQLKGMEKELKKEFAEQKHKSAENVDLVKARIQEVLDAQQAGSLSIEDGLKKCDEISQWMRDLELTRYDVRLLKELLQTARDPFQKVREEEELQRRQKEVENEKARKEEIQKFRQKIDQFKLSVADSTSEAVTTALESLKQEMASLSVTKSEKQTLEKLLKEGRDLLEEKKERAILDLPEADRAALDQLKELLQQKKTRRQEITVQIEEYRKILGGSTLDLMRSMEFNELMRAEKEKRDKLDEGIQEVEEKIRALRNRT